MKNLNIDQNSKKLLTATKTLVLMFLLISLSSSSNTDSILEQVSANSLMQNLSVKKQEEVAFLNGNACIQNEEKDTNKNQFKKKDIESSNIEPTADELFCATKFSVFNHYVLLRIKEELKNKSNIKIHSFLRVFRNIMKLQFDNFYFKILEKNKFLVGFFCSSNPDNSDSKPFEWVDVDFNLFMKHATEYFLIIEDITGLYLEGKAIASFCDEDCADMIIEFLKSICNRIENSYDHEGKSIECYYMSDIRNKCEMIIDLICECTQKGIYEDIIMSYPICYKIYHDFNFSDDAEDTPYCFLREKYTEK